MRAVRALSVSRAARTNPGDTDARIVFLDTPREPYRVTVVLSVRDRASVEEIAQLYWAMHVLDPLVADFDDDRTLVAQFVRHAPCVEVAAWELAGEVRALAGARLRKVQAGLAGRPQPELVLRERACAGSDGEGDGRLMPPGRCSCGGEVLDQPCRQAGG